MKIFANRAYVGSAWVNNLMLTVRDGKIAEVKEGASVQDADVTVDTLLPALANLHSHAFQRAMAGMSEYRAAGRDSFWTWRSLMYRFLDRLTPEQMQSIAALVYMEMLEAGYASVGEFHYVHHQPGGRPYEQLSELSQRIFAASSEAGIGLTHLPVFYTYGGVNQEPLAGGQMRFSNDIDRFQELLSECRSRLQQVGPDANIGVAPHSLRAVSPADLQALISANETGPVHIHIAEQQREVFDVQEKMGKRPVAWLLENLPVDPRWCLIHATHMTQDETIAMARSGAVAGLCPITEANLGDGIFNGREFLQNQGAFGVGSDSNVRISLTEELRTLEYSQRLRDQERNLLAPEEGSTGERLYLGAARGGAQAIGRHAGAIEVGAWADLTAINSQDPALCALKSNQLLDGLCFAASDNVVTDTWSAGRHVVQNGRHIAREKILAAYRSSIDELLQRV